VLGSEQKSQNNPEIKDGFGRKAYSRHQSGKKYLSGERLVHHLRVENRGRNYRTHPKTGPDL
jgi:hypothetical protein